MTLVTKRYAMKFFYMLSLMTSFLLLGFPTQSKGELAVPQKIKKQFEDLQPGDIVAHFKNIGVNYYIPVDTNKDAKYYRKYLGKDKNGNLILQQFYIKSQNKQSDPFIIKKPIELGEVNLSSIEGFTITWHENGQKAIEGNFINGRREGIRTSWYENGQKYSEENYINGRQKGTHTNWHENGQKSYEGKYINGNREGIHTEWYENGQKSYEGKYISDLKEGTHTKWHENGQKSAKGKYRYSDKNGIHTEWYENGQKSHKGKYVSDAKEGIHTEWHENGQKSHEGKYVYYNKEGLHTEWDQSGKKINVCLYADGEEVECE